MDDVDWATAAAAILVLVAGVAYVNSSLPGAETIRRQLGLGSSPGGAQASSSTSGGGTGTVAGGSDAFTPRIPGVTGPIGGPGPFDTGGTFGIPTGVGSIPTLGGAGGSQDDDSFLDTVGDWAGDLLGGDGVDSGSGDLAPAIPGVVAPVGGGFTL